MRLAITGKGGVGKTALTATLARVMARDGRRVLACDFDVNPGLDVSLGPLDGDGSLPAEATVESDEGQYGYQLHGELPPAEAVRRFAARGPDGIRLLSLGSIGQAGHDLARTHYAARQVAAGFDAPDWDVLVDMEAGTKDVFDGSYVGFVDLIVAVTDSQPVAELACRRLAGIAAGQPGPPVALVANRATPSRLQAAHELADELSVRLLGSVPDDEGVRRADVAGRPVVDHAGWDSPAVLALQALLPTLEEACSAASQGEPAPASQSSTGA